MMKRFEKWNKCNRFKQFWYNSEPYCLFSLWNFLFLIENEKISLAGFVLLLLVLPYFLYSYS